MTTIPLADLRAAVRQVSVALNTSSPIDSIRGIRIAGGTLSATNLELAAIVEAPGLDLDCLVHGGSLRAGLDSLPAGDVMVEETDDGLAIHGKRARVVLPLMPVADFPELPQIDDGALLDLGSDAVADFIAAVGAALPDDGSNPILSALNLTWTDEGVRAFAVDRIRLYRTGTWPGGERIGEGAVQFMPPALSALPKGEDVTIVVGPGRVRFQAGPLRLYARTVDGQPPNPDSVIPPKWEADARFTPESVKGIEAITTPFRVTGDKGVKPIILTFTSGSSEVGVEIAGDHLASSLQAEVDEPYTGPDLQIAANPLKFSGALAFGGPVIQVISALRPMRFTGNGDHEALVMPIDHRRAEKAAAAAAEVSA